MTWAVLSPGDLGSGFGALLRELGHRVVTTLEGRSDETRRRSERAGLEILAGLRDVVARADVVVSLVPPDAALPLARRYATEASARKAGQLYVDANTLPLPDLREVASTVQAAGGRFLDAAFHGAAAFGGQDRLRHSTSLFLAGDGIETVAAALDPPLRIVRLDDRPGAATELKLFLASLNKGICALFAEGGAAAARAGLLAALLEALGYHYPHLLADLERMMPSYTRHAARRAVEMDGLADRVRELGLEPLMADAGARVIRRIAAAFPPSAAGAAISARELVDVLARNPEELRDDVPQPPVG
jgi:3-hydroxyisobutyrate dehydrogenase-like beta-hydroxyacid dehydrogenase